MQQQLGITRLRPGPSGNAGQPNQANYDEALANPYPDLPEVLKFEKGGNVSVDAKVPNTFFFDRARTVSGTADNLSRAETGFHGKVVFIAPVGAGWEVLVSGGPSFFQVEQDLVEDIKIKETYPYDTATFDGAVATRHSTSGLGFNVGADVTRLLTPHMGIGAAVVISRATLHFDTFSDPARDFDVGGTRIGGGLRFRF